jgi:hypothetical protein
MWMLLAAQVVGLFGCETDMNHERQALKTRAAPSSLAGATSRTLAQVLTFAIPAGHKDTERDAIKPREPKLYQVTGFVRKIKLSDDDCDLHLELAASGNNGEPRVIVEIPPNQATLQHKAASMFNLSESVHSHTFNGAKAKRITVTGFAFLDLSHQCTKFPKAGCKHGGERVQTLWEMHPVLAIRFAP